MSQTLDHIMARVEEAKQRAELYEQSGQPEEAVRALQEIDAGLQTINNATAALELDLVALRGRVDKALNKKRLDEMTVTQVPAGTDRAHV